MGDKKDYLRRIASVNDVIQAVARGQSPFRAVPRDLLVDAVRSVVDGVREAIIAAKDDASLDEIKTGPEDLIPLVEEAVKERMQISLRRVINATGVVIHTNLGRSVLAAEALEEIDSVARSYSNLEYDLETGARGSRMAHLQSLLQELTGAPAALVVNNNAAAVLLALTAHAQDREVIISRSQLIEIGGSFRIPDVLVQSGARLVEVGTTNKTYLEDYRKAIHGETAVIMRAHPSNYRIVGFTSEPELAELAQLAHEFDLMLLDDLGSGVLLDLAGYGLPPEPTVLDSLQAGADLVCFSGDKLLGGPQAGIILGQESLIETMAKHPLARAVRADKLTIAGLEATLRIYHDPKEAVRKIPTLAMLTAGLETLKRKAQKLAGLCRKASDLYEVQVAQDLSRAGGGALPMSDLPTMVVALTSSRHTPNQLEEALRKYTPPIIARISEDRVLLDVRTLFETEFQVIADALADLASLKTE